MRSLFGKKLCSVGFLTDQRLLITLLLVMVTDPLTLSASPSSPVQDSPVLAPWTSVKYRERPLGEPAGQAGRVLTTDGAAYYGIDINSRVDIEIDSNALRARLLQALEEIELSDEAKVLQERLDTLSKALTELEAVIQLTNETVTAFEAAEGRGDYAAFQRLAMEMGSILSSLLEELFEARRARQLTPDASPSAVEALKQSMFNSVLGQPGYDWERLEELLQEEIRATDRILSELLPGVGTRIEIQAHLLNEEGGSAPIFLPGYNEVTTGPISIYRKVRFEMSPDEKKLFVEVQTFAMKVGSVKSLGQALLESVRRDFQPRTAELEAMFSDLRSTLLSSREKLEVLTEWADPAKRDEWFRLVGADLLDTAAVGRLRTEWEGLERILAEIRDDIRALEAYSDLRLTGQTPNQAMDSILAALRGLERGQELGGRILNPIIWQRRVEAVRSFADALKSPDLSREMNLLALEQSPVGDIEAALESLQSIVTSLGEFSGEGRRWLAGFLGSRPMLAAANLAPPEGQRQRLLEENLGTTFDLTTIRQGRAEGGQVRVQYRFFHGDEPLVGKGWSDRFLIRVFGWQDRILASFIFTNQNGRSDFKPTAAVSWIIKKRPWPSGNASGLAGLEGFEWFSGFGFSAMALDYDTDVSVEMGIAATLSLIDHRLLLGYGANLQVDENRGFWFFGLRLFSTSGFIPTR